MFISKRNVNAAVAVFALLFMAVFNGYAFERRTAVVEAVEKAGPAVVNIRTEQIIKRRSSTFFGFADPFFDEFFRDLAPPRTYRTQSLGSGVVIDKRGYILTNAHVIEKASKIYAALPGMKKELEATLVGLDRRIDLAVLKVEGRETFPYIAPARSDDLLVGESVIAIGNPLGLGHSITTGVISAQRRRISMGNGIFSMFIQTDALINPGNSGGPLININGELIGINTAIAQKAQGIDFAIPIDTAKRILDDLIEFGRVRQAFLGIYPGPVDEVFTKSRGEGGVLVKAVDPGSPASDAGLQVADVILALDDNTVTTPSEYRSLLATYTPDDKVRVNFLRGAEVQEVTVSLESLPENYGITYAERFFGLTLTDSREGVMIHRVKRGSPADQVGIRPGDMVAELAGEPVKSIDDFSLAIEHFIGQEPLRFLVVRGSRLYYVDLP